MSLVKPCSITTNLIIIGMLYLFKSHVYFESCNKYYKEAGDKPVYDGKKNRFVT
jgi:hypothetical protein